MKRTQKQVALEAYKKLTDATLEYLIAHNTGEIVFDGWDAISYFYEQQQLQADRYFNQRRLDRLQQQLNRLVSMPGDKLNENFAQFIREKTNSNLDMFAGFRAHVNEMLVKGKVVTEKELADLSRSFFLLKKAGEPIQDEAALKKMMHDYGIKMHTETTVNKKKKEYTESVTTDLGDGREIVSIRIRTGPKPKHLEEQESKSPDGKRKIMVTQWSNGKNANTSVNVFFEKANGCIYSITGIHPDIKAYWKDNNTIIVETRKAYTSFVKHQEIRSYQDTISIEYLEQD